MPYKSAKIPINNELLDRRVKLLQADKEEVRKLHKQGYSMRKLAIEFKVSRRLIAFIIYPERLKAERERDGKKKWRRYYTKEKHRNYMKRHSRYKQELYIKGLITNNRKET